MLKKDTKIYNLPSLIFTWSWELLSIDTYFIVNNWNNLPYKLDSQTPNNSQTINEVYELIWSTATTLTWVIVDESNYKTFTWVLWYNEDIIWTISFWNRYLTQIKDKDIVVSSIPPITQWKDIAWNEACTNDDYVFTLSWSTYRWAWCNSIFWTWLVYNANNQCYNYSWTDSGWTSCYWDTTKENTFNPTSWEDNIWWKLYLWDNAPSACPSWWHLPTDQDFLNLETSLWCTDIATSWWWCSWLWWSWKASKNSTNSIIKALKLPLAGYRDGGSLRSRGNDADLWSSTEYDSTNARGRGLTWYITSVYRGSWDKSTFGFSVRCIKY